MWQLSNAHHRPSWIIEVAQFAVAHPQPFADARQDVGRVAHRLHAAGDGDVDVAGGDALGGEHDGFQPGAADLVDRERGDGLRQSAAERRLPGGGLAEAGGDDVAHDALVDDGRVDAGACHGLAHDQRAELGGSEVLQRAEELAGRESDGADDDGFAHGALSVDECTVAAAA